MSRPKGVQLMEGNHACAWGAIDAGARFYAGYPITPSSEISEVCARELPGYGGTYIQMEDEIGSMAAIVGASLSGKKSFTATSGPGFSLMQENLGVGIYQEAPCVLVDIQRVGPATGLATQPAQADVMQARWGTHGDHPIIALSPASVQEMYYLTIRAFNLAERFRSPVILLGDQVVGQTYENIALPDPDSLEIMDRKKPIVPPEEYLPYQYDEEDLVPPMAAYGDKHILHASSTCHCETGYSNFKYGTNRQLLTRLKNKIYNYIDEIIDVEYFGPEDADVTLISFGSSSRVCKYAVGLAEKEGIKVNLLRLISIWPFPDREVQQALARTGAAVVAEMNQGQLIGEVNRVNTTNTPVHLASGIDGELIRPEIIMTSIREAVK